MVGEGVVCGAFFDFDPEVALFGPFGAVATALFTEDAGNATIRGCIDPNVCLASSETGAG